MTAWSMCFPILPQAARRRATTARGMANVGFVAVMLLAAAGCKRRESAGPPASQPAGAATSAVTPDSPPLSAEVIALNNRGVGLMGKFEYESARLVFERAWALAPGNADLMVNLAIATLNRQREGDEDRALELLADALRLEPHNLRGEYCTGILRLYLQSPSEAQPRFQKVCDADAGDAFAAYYLGQCLAQQKQYAAALEQYRRAVERDPHIRSAFYAMSQAHRALGHDDEAARMLAEFQALERNPQAHLAEFKYTRMGPKAMARTIDDPNLPVPVASRPQGPIFLDPEPLLTNGDQFKWKAGAANTDRPISITACDIDHDGDIDVFLADCVDDAEVHNAVCINDGAGRFALDAGHPLARIKDVNAALWGDVDNDGLTDVYLCRKGANTLCRQTAKNVWADVTASTQTANGTFDSVDGALFDADHDGDLDIFVVNGDGPNELFNNNRDGTFRPIAAEAGIVGAGNGSKQMLPVDLDGDRDLDIIVRNNEPPHDVWENERAWHYLAASGFDEFLKREINPVIAADADVDGEIELYELMHGTCNAWTRDAQQVWRPAIVAMSTTGPGPWSPHLAFADVSSAGRLQRIQPSWYGIYVADSDGPAIEGVGAMDDRLTAWACLTLGDGVQLFATRPALPPLIWRPGSGRFPFATVSFTGRQVTSDNKQVRSNVSGIGTHFAARIDSKWVAGSTLRHSSGPGQSLQPVAIGLGGASKIDFLSINWSDGVFQTELDLEAGRHHVIEETQRQLSSCPVLFAWNGEHYQFITDLLGVGGIGYMTARGEYAPSRPWENLLLPPNIIQPRDDQYTLKLGEPMEEACYLDAARLVAYDLPPGWDMTVDDRMNIAGPEPSGAPLLYQRASVRLPVRATDANGEDVAATLRNGDLTAADFSEIDARFIGLLQREQELTWSVEAAPQSNDPGALRRSRRWALVIDGWVEYPYSQTMFAAWQAKATYQAPTLEIRNVDGEWRTIAAQFGYPAGMPRQMALPLPGDLDLAGALEMRIRTNQEIYFDRIALIEIEACQQAVRTMVQPVRATLAEVGFAQRTTGPQRQPQYDYDGRSPVWDTRHQRGWYTAFGRVDELVAREEGALAIFGPGEEIEMRFDAAALPPLAGGWTRRFVLEVRGWCKDMDLYTQHGDELEPLPAPDAATFDAEARRLLHSRFNTRYMSGH